MPAGATYFPGVALDSIGNPSGFSQVENLTYTKLTADASASTTTLTVASTAGFPSTPTVIVCGREVIWYGTKTATTFNGCVRGHDGTTAAIHAKGATVGIAVVAAHHNDLAAAIVAIEARLGTGDLKNRFINGDMRVKQRAVMPTADNSYALDGLRLLLGAANAATISQDTAVVPSGGSGYAVKLTVGSGNNNKFGIFMPLANNDILDLRGGPVSVQAKMIATAGLGDIRWALLQRTSGTADGSATVPNSLVDPITTWGSGGSGITTLADNWVAINTPANLSVGTTFGTTIFKLENQSVSASALNLALLIWNDDTTTTQTTDTLSITDVQLEKGKVCTEFERRPYSQQLTLCEHWLQVFKGALYPIQCFGSGLDATHSDFGPLIRRTMRVGPTLTATAADWASVIGGAVNALSAISLLYSTPNGVWCRGTHTGGVALAALFLSSATAGGQTDLILSSEL